MEQIIMFIFNTYSSFVRFLKRKKYRDIQNSAYVVVAAFFLMAALSKLFPAFAQVFVHGFAFIVVSILLLFTLEREYKHIKFITKGKSNTARQILKEFSHLSFIYCLFLFSLIVSCWVFFLRLIICIAFSIEFAANLFSDFLITFVIIAFCFSFLYFCYHIYYNPSSTYFDTIKLRIQQYAAILSSVTFILWCFGLDSYFKLFLSGLALVFSWLQYILSVETQKNGSREKP